MSHDELPTGENPETLFIDTIHVFDCEAVPVPPGTLAPPRPPGKERPHYLSVVVPGNESTAAAITTELLRQVQRVVDGLPANAEGLDALRRAAAELAKID